MTKTWHLSWCLIACWRYSNLVVSMGSAPAVVAQLLLESFADKISGLRRPVEQRFSRSGKCIPRFAIQHPANGCRAQSPDPDRHPTAHHAAREAARCFQPAQQVERSRFYTQRFSRVARVEPDRRSRRHLSRFEAGLPYIGNRPTNNAGAYPGPVNDSSCARARCRQSTPIGRTDSADASGSYPQDA